MSAKPSERAALAGIDPRPMGRPKKPPPPDAAQRIQALAADGWSIVGVAWQLGVTKETFSRWLKEDESLAEAFSIGRERERRTLHNVLYRQAVEGEGRDAAFAALALLNSRHGYRSDQQVDQQSRVTNVTINLPAARPLSDYIEVVNADGTESHRLPAPRS